MNFIQEERIAPARGQFVRNGLFLTFLALCFFIWMYLTNFRHVLSILGFVLMLVVAAMNWRYAIFPKPGLTLTLQGLRTDMKIFNFRFIPWNEIVETEIVTVDMTEYISSIPGYPKKVAEQMKDFRYLMLSITDRSRLKAGKAMKTTLRIDKVLQGGSNAIDSDKASIIDGILDIPLEELQKKIEGHLQPSSADTKTSQ